MFHNKKIGVWGLGITGISALKFLHNYTSYLSCTDVKPLNQEQKKLLENYQVNYYHSEYLENFLDNHDLILASPGVDLRPFLSYKDKFITELDIFSYFFKKPIIAITGTIGKTSVTNLLSEVLTQSGLRIAQGGNIGIGMLDLIQHQENIDYAVLEVSSFQLEFCTTFAPSCALWTNFFENHLDRHGTFQEYFSAKGNIIKYQTNRQFALLPCTIATKLLQSYRTINSSLYFFCIHENVCQIHTSSLFYKENLHILHRSTSHTKVIYHNKLPKLSFQDNWLMIISTLYLLKISLETISKTTITIPHHRLEKIATYNQIDYYNDSKATVIQATIAATHLLKDRPIILLLGGVSKGVDRHLLFSQLPNTAIKYIICFGSEAETLNTYAQQALFKSNACASLSDAFIFAQDIAQPYDQILFSPSGASFDLFNNYQERGNYFKDLVSNFIKTQQIIS